MEIWEREKLIQVLFLLKMSVELLQISTSVIVSRVQLYVCIRGLRQDMEADEQKLLFC